MAPQLRAIAALAVVLACAAAVHAVADTPEMHSKTYARPWTGLNKTALDDYVAKPDSHYHWESMNHTFGGLGFKAHAINMTSQQWLSPDIVTQSTWWHYLIIVVPEKFDYRFKDAATLYITGGGMGMKMPTAEDEDVLMCVAIALTDGVVCGVLFQIPNEPVTFTGETHGRSEDGIIAYTWNHFINHPDEPEYLLRLPMTKASVRAMDTLTSWIAINLDHDVNRFIVAGASKRGWTTWTTAAVDQRVIGMIPIVMDLLNFVENVHHMWRAFGGWTFAFDDYYKMNFTQDLDNPNMQKMANIIDPYVYRERYATIPKLVINSCGDEFFMPDDNHYWWDDMPGEKHLLHVKDAEHSLVTGLPEVIQGASSFAFGVLSGTPRPEMTWTFGKTYNGGNITVTTSEPPTRIVARWADTTDGTRRDWRLITGQKPCPTITVDGACLHPVLWHADEPIQTGPNTWVAGFDAPAVGWRAFMIEVEFRGDSAIQYIQTTQINIVPDKFPYPDCHGDACRGTLV